MCGLKEGHLPFTARIKVGPAGGQRVGMRGWAGRRGCDISSQRAMVMRVGGIVIASLAGWMPNTHQLTK